MFVLLKSYDKQIERKTNVVLFLKDLRMTTAQVRNQFFDRMPKKKLQWRRRHKHATFP